MPDCNLTKCELELMNVVWSKGRVTVQDVVDALDRSLAYTTVMTTLKVLDAKRGVLKKTKVGRAFVYEATVTREEVSRALAENLTQHLYRGSVKSFVLSLMDGGAMSKSDIHELKRAILDLESGR